MLYRWKIFAKYDSWGINNNNNNKIHVSVMCKLHLSPLLGIQEINPTTSILLRKSRSMNVNIRGGGQTLYF